MGKGTVDHLIKSGARVAILDLPTSHGAEVAKQYGSNAIFTPANVCLLNYYSNWIKVTSENDVKAAFDEVKKSFGRVDAVVNCAGIAYAFKLYSVSKKKMVDLDKIKKTLDVIPYIYSAEIY